MDHRPKRAAYHDQGTSRRPPSWRTEMTTSRGVDIVLEIVQQILLAGTLMDASSQRTLNIFEPVINAPEVEWNVLADVADDDVELGQAVKRRW